MTQIHVVKQNLENVIAYLEPFLGLANCHMVDYFTNNVYQNFVPKNIQNELKLCDKKEVIDCMFNNNLERLPNLKDYVETSKKYQLKNFKDVCLSIDGFYNKLGINLQSLKLNVFMNSKKSHEVEVLSNTAAAVQKISKTSHVVDIGDGKGYLSSMLALHYKIPVLGVDASEINTNSAVDRVEKLSKVWNSLTTGEKSKETSKDLYRQITKYVDEKIDFKDLVETVFLEKPTDISLVGLHTCGNLATASLRIFCARPEIKTICNVGCCYHFIAEQFEQNIKHVIPNKNKTSEFGFPMSQFLIDKQFVIGRSARMMAAQSVDRIFHNKELPSRTIFYRALLQIYMKINHPNVTIKDVGRLRKPATDFSDYTRKALKRLKLDLDISDEKLHAFYKEYECRCDELSIFYLIRCLLAPVVENLILLDRILFLYENGYDQSYLVQLFDPVISPRCYSIIAFK